MSDASKRRKEAVAESNEEDDVSSWEIEEIMPHSLPSGTTFEEWQRTVCSLPKVEKEREWKGKSYAELVNLSEKDKELQKYLAWIRPALPVSMSGVSQRVKQSTWLDFSSTLTSRARLVPDTSER